MNNFKEKLNTIAKEIVMQVAENKLSPDSKELKIALYIKKEYQEELDSGYVAPIYDVLKIPHHGDKPDMLNHILAVVKLIRDKKKSFPEAIRIRAKEESIRESSVRQACCRSMKITAYYWNKFSEGNEAARDYLLTKILRKYRFHAREIKDTFAIKSDG